MNCIVDETSMDSLLEDARTAIFSVGNGRFCTRGTPADAFLVTRSPYPFRGTYLAGLYTRAGWGLEHPFCAPDWTAAAILVDGAQTSLSAIRRELDLRDGVLTLRSEVARGDTRLTCREDRFVSWAHPNLCAQRFVVNIIAGALPVILLLAVDGDVRNSPSKIYKPGNPPSCDARGLRLSSIESLSATSEGLRVVLRARATDHRAAVVAAVRQISGPHTIATPVTESGLAGLRFALPAGATGEFAFEKVCAVSGDLTGFETASDDATRIRLVRGTSFEAALSDHRVAAATFWRSADTTVTGDPAAELAIRYGVWSTRIAAPLDSGGSSIGPKNLTGDWYRGGVFWDMEMYQLPLLAAVTPDRAWNHVRYRINRLPAARALAAQDGYAGARYPFTSFGDGFENPPRMGGLKGQQVHINADIVWGILHTHRLTGDDTCLLDGGLEVLIELARFWLSFVSGPDTAGRWHIRNVCGPDELHAGVDDNTYTNALVASTLIETADLVESLERRYPAPVADLTRRLAYDRTTRDLSRRVAAGLFRPHLSNGAPAAFERYEAEREPNVTVRNIWGAGDKTNKQADTLMLAQTNPQETRPEWLAAAYDHDVPLCTQTSSLSPPTHVIASTRLRRRLDAERFFTLAAGADLRDGFGNTRHGVHGAAQGGVWMAAVHGFGGLQVGARGIALDPILPPKWDELTYGFLFRGAQVRVTVRRNLFTVRNEGRAALPLLVQGRHESVPTNASRTFPIENHWCEPTLKAVLVALDGLLVDSGALHVKAWTAIAGDLGLSVPTETLASLGAVPTAEALKKLFADRPVPAGEAWNRAVAQVDARYREFAALTVSPASAAPVTSALCDALRRDGVKIAAVCGHAYGALLLERAGLTDRVDLVSDGNLITAGLPDPQAYAVAQQRARALPWESLAIVGDRVTAEAARRSGAVVMAVGEATVGLEPHADDLAALSLSRLREIFATVENPLDPYLELNVAKMKTELVAG